LRKRGNAALLQAQNWLGLFTVEACLIRALCWLQLIDVEFARFPTGAPIIFE